MKKGASLNMDMSKNNKRKISAFILCGPFIGTFIIAITFHSEIIFYNPMRFLKGLITPSIIFPMIAAFILITPFGYLLGCIPAIITNLLFKHFFASKLALASWRYSLIYGCLLGFMLAPFILMIAIVTPSPLFTFLYLQFVLILPTTLICTFIEWIRARNRQNINE